MINSMTGYGRSDYQGELGSITVEIRTVNSRYCDIITKIPKILFPIEERIRNILKTKLERGRIEIYCTLDEKRLLILKLFQILSFWTSTTRAIHKSPKDTHLKIALIFDI